MHISGICFDKARLPARMGCCGVTVGQCGQGKTHTNPTWVPHIHSLFPQNKIILNYDIVAVYKELNTSSHQSKQCTQVYESCLWIQFDPQANAAISNEAPRRETVGKSEMRSGWEREWEV